jgi:hypothetical protein
LPLTKPVADSPFADNEIFGQTHTDTESTMKSGYLYVLVHPSDPDLYKVGMTTRHPQERLVEHNSNYSEYAGQIVKETGLKWELKTYFAVPDPNWAEVVLSPLGPNIAPFEQDERPDLSARS